MRGRGTSQRRTPAIPRLPTRVPMPQSNVTLRPSELPADEATPRMALPPRAAGAESARDELELPLSPSPPLSVAASVPTERLSGSGVSLRVCSDLDAVADEWK